MQLIHHDNQPGGLCAIFRVTPEEKKDSALWKKALVEIRKSFAVNCIALQTDFTPVDQKTNKKITTEEEEKTSLDSGTLEYETQFVFVLLGV